MGWEKSVLRGKWVATSCKVQRLCAARCAKLAELMEMQSGLLTRAPKEARVTRGAHWRHLANTIDH